MVTSYVFLKLRSTNKYYIFLKGRRHWICHFLPFKACSPRTVATSRPSLACWAFHCSNLIWRRKIILIMYTSTYYVYKYFNTNVLHICAPLSTFGHFKESGEQLRIEATPTNWLIWSVSQMNLAMSLYQSAIQFMY